MLKTNEETALDTWIKDVKTRHELQLRNIQILETATHLDEANYRSLDSTLKKVTAFMKRLKNIGKTVTVISLLPELEKLNVSNFLDEIAVNICEVKIKLSEVPPLVEFCVKVSSLYSAFPEILTAELKKYVPHKKTDVISDPLKLRVDLRFLADLALNGVIKKEGIQLLGSALSYIVSTDKTEHANVNILMPLCRSLLFDLTCLVPLTQLRLAKNADVDIALYGLISPVFSEKQRNSVANLFQSYFDSLAQHAYDVWGLEMNNLRNSINRQKRTRGDASVDDRQKYAQVKTKYRQLIQNASDFAECLGKELPDFEEPSDDELNVVSVSDTEYSLEIVPVYKLPAKYRYFQKKILSKGNRLPAFNKINWEDEELTEFIMKMLTNPSSVDFEDLDRLASLVGGLSDIHSWIGTQVVDETMKFIRLSLESNHVSLQQRCFSSVNYLGQLFNYNVCHTSSIFLILYLLITFNVSNGIAIDELVIRTQRIRLVSELINIVCEFFCKGSAKIRMDCFFYFFLRFYYETVEKWTDLSEMLGEFPRDKKYKLDELLKKWRGKQKFPKSLVDAEKCIISLSKKTKFKAKEIQRDIRVFQTDEGRNDCRLESVVDDDEDDDLDEREENHQHSKRSGTQLLTNESAAEPEGLNAVTDDNEEQINVHTGDRRILPEDEDFMREMDRLVADTMQISTIALNGPMVDLEVPPVARQRFERKQNKLSILAPDTVLSSKAEDSTIQNSNSCAQSDSANTVKKRPLQMALMTRGKGNRTVLKAINMESSEGMHKSWRQYREQRERERKEMKQVTLVMNERILHQQQEEQLQQVNELLNAIRINEE